MIGHVAKGDRLTLVQTAPDNGYYHINTEQDVIGWVLANSVSVFLRLPFRAAGPIRAAPG